MDIVALENRLPKGVLRQALSGDERTLWPGKAWLTGLNSQGELTFLGVSGEKDHSYGVLLKIDLENERLLYLPLPEESTPLSIFNSQERRTALEEFVMAWPGGGGHNAGSLIRTIPLQEIHLRLSSPIPRPKQIFAVAANYPSHLFVDLSLPDKKALISLLQQARPRVFQKFPPVPAPGERSLAPKLFREILGPFGAIAAPAQVSIPGLNGQNSSVRGHLDYEVVIAVLVDRDLSWDKVRAMSDAELRGVIAGYLLFSDAKVRDPQAMGKILQVFREETVTSDNSYKVGDDALDGTLGLWDESTCHWTEALARRFTTGMKNQDFSLSAGNPVQKWYLYRVKNRQNDDVLRPG